MCAYVFMYVYVPVEVRGQAWLSYLGSVTILKILNILGSFIACVLSVCVCVHRSAVPIEASSVGSPEAGVTGSCEPVTCYEYWE